MLLELLLLSECISVELELEPVSNELVDEELKLLSLVIPALLVELELLLLLDCCSDVELLEVSPSELVELEDCELSVVELSELLDLLLSECNSVELELEV